MGWQWKLAVVVIPRRWWSWMPEHEIPQTERSQMGISTAETFREMARPMFIRLVPLYVPDSGVGACARPMGGYGADPDGPLPGNLAVDLL